MTGSRGRGGGGRVRWGGDKRTHLLFYTIATSDYVLCISINSSRQEKYYLCMVIFGLCVVY
jgi:hypothetical protein